MKKRILSVLTAAVMITTAMQGMVFPAAYAEETADTVVRLDPSDASPFNNGEFEGWGTSLCWWANRVGYSEKMTQQAADLFFSEDGLGLDIARYNLGGGDDPTHNHITRSDSKVPGVWETFELTEDGNGVKSIVYDITNDQNQLNIAKAALEANPDLYFEGFSNSAPYFMTVTGCTGGGDPASSDNLNSEMYDDFAKYIADATALFKKEGIEFKSYSPMNEPDTDYWGVNSPKQEGCHFGSGTSQSKMITETRNALDAKGLNDVLVAGMDETSIDSSVSNYSKLTDEAKTALGRIDTHTYSGSKREQLKQTAVDAEKDLWMSEVDGGWNGFGLADRIILDMNGMKPSAWVMWDIVDRHKDSDFTAPDGTKTEASATLNATDSLWGVGMADHDNETIEVCNKYYAFGQFTRYIKPGMTIIASSSESLAAYDKKTGEIVVVAENKNSTDKTVEFDLRAFSRTGSKVQPVRTEVTKADGEKWALLDEIDVENKEFTATLKANTITTFVVEPSDTAAVTKFNATNENAEYEYTAPASYDAYNKYFAVYDESGVLKAITKNKSKDTLTGDFTNCTFRLLVWDGMTPVASIDEVTTPAAEPVDYMTISGATTVVVGVAYDYTAAIGSSADAPTVTWTVSDDTIADVTADGVVTAKKGGTFTLTAATESGISTAIDIKALDSTQTIRIVNKNSGLGLETRSKGITSDTQLVQWQDRGIDTAAWKLSATEDGYFNIINANADMLLAANSDGKPVISDTIEGTDNAAKWDLINHGGYYEIKSVSLGKSLNVSGQSVANGGSVILYAFGGGDNELWSLSEVTGELEHVVPEVIDYSAKYDGTEYTFVSNVDSLTNNFNDADAKGFVFADSAGLGSDADGESVLLPQNSLSNTSNTTRKGSATLALTTPVTCEDNQYINLAFDMFTPNSNGDSTFTMSSSDGTEIVKIVGNNWGNTYSITIGDADVETEGDGATYFKNNVSDKENPSHISNGGHVEIYYKPSTGLVIVTVKNVTNTSELKTYTGSVTAGKDVGKIYFAGDYTAWNKTMVVDNLVTNIVTFSGTEPEIVVPDPTDAPVLPESGELISMNFDDNDLTSASTYGKAVAVGTAAFETVDEKTCLKLDGTNQTAIKLTDANGNALLTGQENVTVSFKVKPTATATSWWFYAAPNDSAQTNNQEKYLGAFTNSGKLNVERYNNSGSRSEAVSGAFTADAWNDVMISVEDDVTNVYVNGNLIGSAASTVNISDMLGKSSVAYIGKANWGSGEYATGYIDDFVIYNKPVSNPLVSISLDNITDVTENIAVPETDGVTWETSDATVVTADGVITRADETKTATLTAKTTANGINFSREFTVTVLGKAASADSFVAYAENGSIKFASDYDSAKTPYSISVTLASTDADVATVTTKDNTASGSFENVANGTYKVSCTLKNETAPVKTVTRTVTVKEEAEMGAYLFAHFVGTESSANEEQIYFSVSTDGTTWTTLNNSAPVLTSNVGEKGVRDPYILRGEDGKFFVIATDLSIYNRSDDSNRWATCQTSGSKNIVIWESSDLVNWSEASLVKVAPDNAGCTWAPEAVYDPEEGKYMVFWASKTLTDSYATQRIYRSYTSDFKTFEDPEPYIDGGNISNIDTTIIQDKGMYYRFTKNESKSSVTMMKCPTLSGTWKDVASYTINGAAGNTVTGYEGPTIYKLNGDENKWCLLLDYYSKSQGYKPFVTTDLANGAFTSASDFNFGSLKFRHGTVMPITTAEYNALLAQYPND